MDDTDTFISMMDTNQLTWQTLKFQDLDKPLMYSILKLRQAIFVVEQNCVYQDLDDRDEAASHIVCIYKAEIIAYARAIGPSCEFPYSTLSRILVPMARRGKGLGRELVRRSIERSSLAWPNREIRISAQCHLVKFYREFDFRETGPEYLEDGIPHIQMILNKTN